MELSKDTLSLFGGPAWLLAKRVEAFEAAMALGVPEDSNELWRYSPIANLDIASYSPIEPDDSLGLTDSDTLHSPAFETFVNTLRTSVGGSSNVIVCSNGRVVSPYSNLDGENGYDGEGTSVSIATLSSSPDSFEGMPWSDQEYGSDQYPDYFAALNPALLNDALLIEVSPGSEVPQPLLVVHVIDQPFSLVFDRVFLHLGKGAKAAVVEVAYSPPGVDSLLVPVTEVGLDEGASLSYVSIQELGEACTQIGYQVSRLAKDAHLFSLSAAFGGGYTRVRTDCTLEGDGASSKLLAVYFATGEQVMDFRTLQRHRAPRTNSDLLFKGAVAGSSRSVYTGLIHMQKGSSGSEAFQTNRNLVLSEGAHADSVPNLEIEENDVKCSHASAVGPVDEEQRYYLETRGIPPEKADRLIVLGFFDDALDRVPIQGVSQDLRQVVHEKFARYSSIAEASNHGLLEQPER